MNYIFISYSHKDREFASKLAEALTNMKIPFWIDERIDYGTEWPSVIEKHLDDCSVFILLMTPFSHRSPWVQNELARAQLKKKPIFPLLLEGENWLSVQSLQYVDVRDHHLPSKRFFTQLAQYFPQNELWESNRIVSQSDNASLKYERIPIEKLSTRFNPDD